jgi:glycosyltransferase involved in cell wall biosynthesis/peptidoglycan/xylan/chitin deacetylase (PgdA/CDA1 family)
MRTATTGVLMLVENSHYPRDPRVRREAEALVSAGYNVSLIGPGYPHEPSRETINGVRVYRFLAPTGSGALGYAWEYGYSMMATLCLSILVLWRDGFSVIHAANPPDTYIFIGLLYKLWGKKFIYDHHDLAPEMYRARFGNKGSQLVYKVLVGLENLSSRLADHVIVTNESYKTVAMRRASIAENRITIVRNGPDLNQLYLVKPDVRLYQKGKTIIGFVGEMGIQDGVDCLLRALRHLAYDLGTRDFFCILIGAGTALGDLKRLATELGLDDYVWFTGWISDPEDYRRYLSSIDIGVVPDPSNSYNDRSTVIKIMEYMALCKPIVAYDLPEHRFTAQDAALYATPNDESEFARIVAQLMSDPAKRKVMGSIGRARIESELAWSYSVPKLLNVYRGLLSKAKKSSWAWHWWRERGPAYTCHRAIALLKRYGFDSSRTKQRIKDGVDCLARFGCQPTLPIPGRVLAKNGQFCRDLQASGVEFAVHGYDHVDFRALTQEEASHQFAMAEDAFRRNGIEFEGFRCPYLSYHDTLLKAIPNGDFKYSSNRAIWWEVVDHGASAKETAIFGKLQHFYRAEPSHATVATPRLNGRIVEIPASLPDDIQLRDGLKLGKEGLLKAWTQILRLTHRRGEVFTLLFHPELFGECKLAFESILTNARLLQPAVWVAPLREVSRWWLEKSKFSTTIRKNGSGLHVNFHCSDRATLLIRNLPTAEPTRVWADEYSVLQGRSLTVNGGQRPFIGVSPTIPAETKAFLSEQGYILDTSQESPGCSLFLESDSLSNFDNNLQLIDYIEQSHAPLVRFWRWPNEAKSALCITGDLDATSLIDYATRFLSFGSD